MDSEVVQAEQLLVLARFSEAELQALTALKDLPKHPPAFYRSRLISVLLQALYEQERFSEALPSLKEEYGSISSTDFDSIMLWVVLALDAQQATQAASTFGDYLQDITVEARPGEGSEALSNAQYTAACHLFATEVLAKELHDIDGAQHWAQTKTPGLSVAERDVLLTAIEEMRPSSSARLPPKETKKQAKSLPRPLPAISGVKESVAALPRAEEQPVAKPVAKPEAEQPEPPAHSRLLGESLEEKSNDASDSDVPGSSHLWQATETWLRRRAAGVSEVWQETIGQEGPTAAQVGATAAAAVLLYAALSERRSIRRSAFAALRSVGVGLASLGSMAVSLHPNPMSASAARQFR